MRFENWLGVLPLITGLIGIISIIYMNGVKGIGIGFFFPNILYASLMAIGIVIFGFMFMFGLGMLVRKR